ncbi:MAG TPA: phosphatase PAP2 family protein, partial [Roseimicrobium sp.]|nr:phosphatase PAP2 family protein [Roseimicrobium sp.]
MDWFQSIDTTLFRFINQKMSNPVFDRLMPFLSGNVAFYPLLIGLVVWMIWRFRQRGILCALFLLITIAIGDPIICNSLKDLFERPRPFLDISDTVLRVGRGGSFSFPSSHAANWFASAAVVILFFRRSWRWMFPMAAAVAFSRVYNGVHYPSDVVGGA